MITNYHTHHFLCRHAVGNTEDYVKEAIKKGLEELGMSDHAPFEWTGDQIRMNDQEYLEYLDEFHQVKAIYGDQISLKIGLEAEYYPFQKDRYTKWLDQLDYLILGQHYIYYNDNLNNLYSAFALGSKESILEYGKIVVKALHTGYFKILAHPDVFLEGYKEFDETAEVVCRMICDAAAKTDTLLEYNGNGYRKQRVKTSEGIRRVYPRTKFFKIAEEYDCKIILSSDAHDPRQLVDEAMVEAERDFNQLGSKKVTKIKW